MKIHIINANLKTACPGDKNQIRIYVQQLLKMQRSFKKFCRQSFGKFRNGICKYINLIHFYISIYTGYLNRNINNNNNNKSFYLSCWFFICMLSLSEVCCVNTSASKHKLS